MTTITLPRPPSTNHLFRNGKRGRHKTPHYLRWLTLAGIALAEQRPEPVKGPVEVDITVQASKRKEDIDNRAKAVLDLLTKHGVIEDDHKVQELRIRWGDVEGARVEVRSC